MSIQEFPATTAAHRHRWEQRWESTTGICTFKLFSCDCRQFRGRHYGCHGNAEMSDDLLAKLQQAQEAVAALAEERDDLCLKTRIMADGYAELVSTSAKIEAERDAAIERTEQLEAEGMGLQESITVVGEQLEEAQEDAAGQRALVQALTEAIVHEGRSPGRPPQRRKGWRCGLCKSWWAHSTEPEHGEDCPLYTAPAEAQEEGD